MASKCQPWSGWLSACSLRFSSKLYVRSKRNIERERNNKTTVSYLVGFMHLPTSSNYLVQGNFNQGEGGFLQLLHFHLLAVLSRANHRRGAATLRSDTHTVYPTNWFLSAPEDRPSAPAVSAAWLVQKITPTLWNESAHFGAQDWSFVVLYSISAAGFDG